MIYFKILFQKQRRAKKQWDDAGTYTFWGLAEASEGLDASTLTWNNAPGNITTSASDMETPAFEIGTLAASTRGDYTFTSEGLTSLVQNDSNGMIALYLTGHTNGVLLGSGADAPTLSFTTVPEPATMGLLGIGGLALLRRRSRKA